MTRHSAETAATEFESVWAKIGEPHGDLWRGLTGTVRSTARDAFEAGAASRQGEVDRLAAKVAAAERIVTLAYRGAECVRPIYNSVGFTSEQGDGLSSSTRRSCGECWGCRLAKAAADYRGLK